MSDENNAAPFVVAGELEGLIGLLRELAATKHDDLGIAADAADALAAMQAKGAELEHLSEERRVLWRNAQSECVQAGRELKAAQARIAALTEALEDVTYLEANGGWFAICLRPKFCLFAATLDEVQAMADRAKAFARAALKGGE